jgi:hypothetical protein
VSSGSIEPTVSNIGLATVATKVLVLHTFLKLARMGRLVSGYSSPMGQLI